MRRAVLALIVAVLALPIAALATIRPSQTHPGIFDATLLDAHIPEPMRSAYLDAADTWNIDWALLAAIGKLACDHQRARTPGCWPPGSVSHTGARGPMQLLGSTWRRSAGRHDPDVSGPPVHDGHGYATDGDGDQIADPWNIYDAVHTAARYLADLDIHDDPRRAIAAYSTDPARADPTAGHSYATRILEISRAYRTMAGFGGPGSPVEATPAQGFNSADGCSIKDPTGTGGCVTPRTAHLVETLRTTFGDLPIACWAPRPDNPTSDHPHGRACDITYGAIGRLPTPNQRADGWRTAHWLVTNADTLGVTYIIWDGRIWTPTTGWRPYTSTVYNVSHPTGGHYDHIHISVQRNHPK